MYRYAYADKKFILDLQIQIYDSIEEYQCSCKFKLPIEHYVPDC